MLSVSCERFPYLKPSEIYSISKTHHSKIYNCSVSSSWDSEEATGSVPFWVSCKHKHSTFFFSNTSFAPDKISPSSILQEHGMWSRCSREYGQIQRKISCIDRPEVTWRPPRFLRKISRIKPCCCRQITSAKFSLAPKYEVLSFSRKLCWKRSLSWGNYITLILASGTHK